MSTYIPVTTLSNFRENLVPVSLSDLFYLQQGSEHDRDSAATLGQILESQVIQSFLNDRENWRTFHLYEDNSVTLGDYQGNVIIVPSAKDQSVTFDHFPANGMIIYAPDWDSESATTAVTVGTGYRNWPITKGGVGIFYSKGVGSSVEVIGGSLISSAPDSLAQLKELIVDDLIVKSDLTLPASSILSGNIATKAVTADKIANGAVTVDKIGSGAVTPEKIATGAVTADKINTHAVETDKIKDKAVTSEKLADQLAFVKTPKFPRKIYEEMDVASIASYVVDPAYDGVIFITSVPVGEHVLRMHFNDADNQFQEGATYRIYNNTINNIIVKSWGAEDTFTQIPAWTFKDFYYGDSPGWELA